ncbi:MAG: ATP-binding protein [Alphaproteobacteria bacterium]
MLLRTRISLVALGIIFLAGVMLVTAGRMVERELSDRLRQTTVSGTAALWSKTIAQTLDRMEADTTGVTRNSESIHATDEEQPLALDTSLDNVFNRLNAMNVATNLRIIGTDGLVLHAAEGEEGAYTDRPLIRQSLKECVVTRGVERDDDGRLVAALVFPLLLHRRVVGVAVYEKRLDDIVADMKLTSGAEVFVVGLDGVPESATDPDLYGRLQPRLPAPGGQSFDTRTVATPVSWDLAAFMSMEFGRGAIDAVAHSVTVLPIRGNDGSPLAHLVSIRDGTESYLLQQRTTVTMYGLGGIVVLGSMGGLYLYLAFAFKPLTGAVAELHSMSHDDEAANAPAASLPPGNEIESVAAAIHQFRRNAATIERFRGEREQARDLMEATLRQSHDRLRAITSNLAEAIILMDESGHVAFANPAAQRLVLGDPAESLVGRDLRDILEARAGCDHGGQFIVPFDCSSDTIRCRDVVFVNRLSGSTFNVACSCAPFVEGERVQGKIISFYSIDSLKQAQWEASQAARLASLGRLAAGIAHEINTPVQYISGNINFLQGAFNDISSIIDEYEKYCVCCRNDGLLIDKLDEISSLCEKHDLPFLRSEIPAALTQSMIGVSQVSRIVLSMKEFSHPGTMAKSAVDLNRAIRNTVVVSRNEWKTSAEVFFELADDLPLVSCRLAEINQVIMNLISNASQAIASCGKGLGRITIATARNGDYVEIRVTDTGPGVPMEIRERIFEPFFTTKGVGEGTGQGLAISHDVVTVKHGGRIFVVGEPGSGATFVVRLPIDSPGGQPDE